MFGKLVLDGFWFCPRGRILGFNTSTQLPRFVSSFLSKMQSSRPGTTSVEVYGFVGYAATSVAFGEYFFIFLILMLVGDFLVPG